MSEQNKSKSFMEELDQWTETTVVSPLHEAITEGDSRECDAACQQIKRAIRQKVLDSYRNGQAVGTKAPLQPKEKFRR